MTGKELFSFRNDFQIGIPSDFQIRQAGDKILREHQPKKAQEKIVPQILTNLQRIKEELEER